MAAAGAEAVVIDDVWKAAAYGDIEKLVQMLTADPSCTNRPDSGGYLALQWAALNNRVAAATVLLERGADVNGTDGQGQTALHWAAVRGAVPAAELLLRAGARLDRADSRGYTPAHVAAQYGHTPMLYHFAVRWSADLEVLDSDGRSPLHWTAYKGFPDALRLLLFLDADLLRADREGCTPLHWAAIKGNAEVLYLLAQAGGSAALCAVDNQGATPAQLAQEKGHSMLSSYLATAARQASKKKGGMSDRWLSIATAAGITALLMLYVNACVLCAALPAPSGAQTAASYAVLLTAGLGLFFMWRTASGDPGVLRVGLEGRAAGARVDGAGGRGDAAQRLDLPALWAGNWGAMCVSCKLVRPMGAKHCAVLNKCVSRFDHFCPWVGNTVGKLNHRDFALFLLLESAALLISVTAAAARVHAAAMPLPELAVTAPSLLAFLAIDASVAFPVIMLTVAQMTQISRNITTNELANMHRYPYLRTKEGAFTNPFDKGCSRNLRDFMLLPAEARDRDVEFAESVSLPLLEQELQQLLSGGRSGATVVSMPKELDGKDAQNGGHRNA